MRIVATEIWEDGYGGGGESGKNSDTVDMDLHNHIKALRGGQAEEGIGYRYQLWRF